MSEGASVDIETAQIHPKDEVTASFAAEHQVKTVFLVTFKPETYEEAKLVMRKISGENRRILLRRYGRLYTNVCVTE